MRTAELSGSDPDFAGIMLRCGDPDFEILVFLIRPLPPRARPRVSIDGKSFQGTVVPPGASILLPREATALARERWNALKTLSVRVDDDGTVVRGVVALDGFSTALPTLAASCAVR
jgi:hypothetical protein